jgi:hypothetical protein
MSNPQVVIVREDKRIRHKLLHAIAFALTGGTSGLITAAEAASHASYNARTRKLQEQAAGCAPVRRGRRPKVKFTAEERAYMAAHAPARKA